MTDQERREYNRRWMATKRAEEKWSKHKAKMSLKGKCPRCEMKLDSKFHDANKCLSTV